MDERFVVCLDGDSFSPFWNVYYHPEEKMVEFRGNGISGEDRTLDHYAIDSEDDIDDIVSQLKVLLLDTERDEQRMREEWINEQKEKK